MIKNITSSSPHIYASGGGTSMPYISPNHSNPATGMVRMNGNDLEVYDGNMWMRIYMNDSNIGLNSAANSAIDWAIKKMDEEKEWKALAEKNQAVKIALDNLEQARQHVDITAKLAREYEQTTN